MVNVTLTRILYMEDDPGLSRLLQKSLQRRGYNVDLAGDGEEGLAKLAATPYDLLLVDYDMPFCGGIDVIRTLAGKGALIPTIMVTGQGNEEIAVEALKLGASDYLVKDVEMKYLDLLPVVVDRTLYQHHLLKEHRVMMERMQESEERYRRLIDLSPDGIAVLSEGKLLFVNSTGARILGATNPSEIEGKPFLDCIAPGSRDRVRQSLEQSTGGKADFPRAAEKLLRFDGTELDVDISGVAFVSEGKPAVQVIFRDVTEQRKTEERLQRLAMYDALTGLPNRVLFFDRMNQLLALAKRNNFVLALLYMDLDRFKAINDTLGHEAGDSVLVEAGRRMTACTRRADTVARMGGDEFIGICGRIAAPRDAAIVAEKIIASLGKPFDVKDGSCSLGASIGISLYPQDGADVETLVNKADTAMYRVKETGQGGYLFYSDLS